MSQCLFAAGEASQKLLLVDFQNITSFPIKDALRGKDDGKATYLRDSDAHVSCGAEHHLNGFSEQQMVQKQAWQ